MNLQQLRFVQETARQGFSFTRAAHAIGTSQPALSRGILELEAELGVDLFVRHGKRVLGLTEPGKAILARVERVLAEVAGIEQVTADLRARDDGELRVATTHTQARYVLPAVVREFRRRYPAVRLTLLQGSPRQITDLVLSRQADFAIATELPDDQRDLLLVPSVEWEHVVLVPADHPLAGATPSLQALVRHPLITYVEEFAGRRHIDRAFAEAGLKPDVVLAAVDSDVIKTYVRVGLGVGIMADLGYDAAQDGGLVATPAGFLFGFNKVKLGVRRDAFLRGFALSFIELFAPDVDSRTLERLMRSEDAQEDGKR